MYFHIATNRKHHCYIPGCFLYPALVIQMVGLFSLDCDTVLINADEGKRSLFCLTA